MNDQQTDKVCASCGKHDASLICNQCKCVSYCSQQCLDSHRQTHEVDCMDPSLPCTRCGKKTAETPVCQVPHPGHLTSIIVRTMGSEGVSYTVHCKACQEQYVLSGSSYNYHELPVTSGPEYCFQGNHTGKELPSDDERRVHTDTVVLVPPSLPSKVEQLDASKIRVLKIFGDGGFSEDEKPVLTRHQHFPLLEELVVEDVNIQEIYLTPQNAPKLHALRLQNVSEECKIDICLPNLKFCSIQFYGPSDLDGWVNTMLNHATQLEEFDSYKLRVESLKFASNHLRRIRLHRAELLSILTIWAPRLVELDLQACWDLQQVKFLNTHPLKKELPKGFQFNEPLHVNGVNATLGGKVRAAINAHPRIQEPLRADPYDDDDDDDDDDDNDVW